MKFVYVDESGDQSQGDTFVMAGVMVDAYKLRRKTELADKLVRHIFSHAEKNLGEIKTSQFIAGKSDWSRIPGAERRGYIDQIVDLALDNGGKIFGVALSFERLSQAFEARHEQPFGNNYWAAASLFVSSQIQKRMQVVKGNKGLTIFVMDDNKKDMPLLLDGIHSPSDWFDGLYKVRKKIRGKQQWIGRKPVDRFDQILNTAFPIASHHSSLVQFADVICFIYRRHLELAVCGKPEKYAGEADFYEANYEKLELSRETLGNACPCSALDFYKQSVHPKWKL